MIARHRGEERLHSRWRPAAGAGVASAGWDAESDESLDPEQSQPQLLDRASAGSRRLLALVGVVAVIVIAAITSQHRSKPPQGADLPSTTTQWVAQWTAASLDNPALVCQHLFAPTLAAAFKADTGRSCLTYYGSVRSSSFRIRHVLDDGPTAAVEAQQLGHGRRWGYFTIVLSQVHGGWQAVDVVPGGSVRPRGDRTDLLGLRRANEFGHGGNEKRYQSRWTGGKAGKRA